MNDPLPNILDELEAIADYDGPWLKLRHERKLLRARLKELREREARLEDVLVIALVGGSGVGKSTLLNALAGDQLAKTSEMRPCTSVPTIYHPPGAVIDVGEAHRVAGSALEHLIIVDTPDSDTILLEHRERTVNVLKKCDLVLVCGSPDKYLDDATWSLLRPLQGERAIVLIETKAEPGRSVREHWERRIREQGFAPAGYFAVQAIRALDRKLNNAQATPEELDFPKLEDFLKNELTRERIARIKRSNAAGLLGKTVTRLRDRVREADAPLRDLEQRLATASRDLNAEALRIVEERLFAETHLWAHALNREIALRAKGLVGSLYNLLNLLRTLPARITGTLSSPVSVLTRQAHLTLPHTATVPRRAASAPLSVSGENSVAANLSPRPLASDQRPATSNHTPALFAEDLDAATDEIAAIYLTHQADLALAFTRAGLAPPAAAPGLDAYRDALNHRVAQVLRGPARDTLLLRARLLTSWPATGITDALPALFIAYAGLRLLRDYFSGFLQQGYIGYTLAVLALLLTLELTALTLTAHLLAHTARQSALHHLRQALLNTPTTFQTEQTILEEANDIKIRIERLAEELT